MSMKNPKTHPGSPQRAADRRGEADGGADRRDGRPTVSTPEARSQENSRTSNTHVGLK